MPHPKAFLNRIKQTLVLPNLGVLGWVQFFCLPSSILTLSMSKKNEKNGRHSAFP